jgi:hypothetical protein
LLGTGLVPAAEVVPLPAGGLPARRPDGKPAGSKAAPSPAGDLEALEREQAELRGRIVEAARGRTAALRRLTALRRANETLQNAFLALERALPAGADALDSVFADERQSPEARMTLGWGSPGLEQILPVSSVGLSAIELSLCDIAQRPGSRLHVHLTSREEQQVVDRWTVPIERLTAGWTMFALTRPLVGRPRTLELRLDFEGQADAGVSLHLGRVQPVRMFQVRNAASGAALRPNNLSMRLWCGEPFAAHATQPNIIAADVRRMGPQGMPFIPLAPALLGKAAHSNADEVKFDFAPVSHMAYRIAIACHPPARGMTLASVPLPPGLRVAAVASEAEVGNDKAKAVEFALVLAADAARAKELLSGESAPRPEEAFSGWHPASFEGRVPIEANVAEAGTRYPVLYLATRMSKPGNNNFAWARFRNLSLMAAPR